MMASPTPSKRAVAHAAAGMFAAGEHWVVVQSAEDGSSAEFLWVSEATAREEVPVRVGQARVRVGSLLKSFDEFF